MSNILIYVDKLEYISDYRKAGVSAFLFGLSNYCVGYNTYTLDDIKSDFEESLNVYLKDVSNELTYSKIYGILASHVGVEDISNLLVNDNNINISISEDKIINISEINLEEVI